jgi:hypothetical protein
MPRVRSVPSYRLHKPSGQAVVTIRYPGGVRRDVYLGEYDSPPSRQEYARIVAELAVAPATPQLTSVGQTRPAAQTVNEVLLAYLEYAGRHYRRPDGKATDEFAALKVVSRYVRELYGHTLAASFGPLALRAVRERFIEAGWCRRSINQQVERIRRIFRWAVAEELVPPAVHQALSAVAGLK